MQYKQTKFQKLCWIIISVIIFIVFSLINKTLLEKIGLFLGGMSIIICINVLWKWTGWKVLFTIITISLVDIDHFLFSSKGFFEKAENTVKILHAFHSVEMLLFIMIINFFTEIENLNKGILIWLFHQKNECKSSIQYYITWTARIIQLGILMHYIMELFIDSFGQKWGYYDYSVIHWSFAS
jgi:hypothetical protein